LPSLKRCDDDGAAAATGNDSDGLSSPPSPSLSDSDFEPSGQSSSSSDDKDDDRDDREDSDFDDKEDSDLDCNAQCAIRAIKLLSPCSQPASQSLHVDHRDEGYLTGHVSLSPTQSIWDPEDAQSPGPQADAIDDDFKPAQPGELGQPTKQQERLQAAALARSQESMKPSLLQKCQRDEIEIQVGLTVDTLADVHGLMGAYCLMTKKPLRKSKKKQKNHARVIYECFSCACKVTKHTCKFYIQFNHVFTRDHVGGTNYLWLVVEPLDLSHHESCDLHFNSLVVKRANWSPLHLHFSTQLTIRPQLRITTPIVAR
jgi:hypothetical protein